MVASCYRCWLSARAVDLLLLLLLLLLHPLQTGRAARWRRATTDGVLAAECSSADLHRVAASLGEGYVVRGRSVATPDHRALEPGCASVLDGRAGLFRGRPLGVHNFAVHDHHGARGSGQLRGRCVHRFGVPGCRRARWCGRKRAECTRWRSPRALNSLAVTAPSAQSRGKPLGAKGAEN